MATKLTDERAREFMGEADNGYMERYEVVEWAEEAGTDLGTAAAENWLEVFDDVHDPDEPDNGLWLLQGVVLCLDGKGRESDWRTEAVVRALIAGERREFLDVLVRGLRERGLNEWADRVLRASEYANSPAGKPN